MSKTAIKLLVALVIGTIGWELLKRFSYSILLINRGLHVGLLPILFIALAILGIVLYVTKNKES